jgi:hypothetical protein
MFIGGYFCLYGNEKETTIHKFFVIFSIIITNIFLLSTILIIIDLAKINVFELYYDLNTTRKICIITFVSSYILMLIFLLIIYLYFETVRYHHDKEVKNLNAMNILYDNATQFVSDMNTFKPNNDEFLDE